MNRRTPAEITAVAADVLAPVGPAPRAPEPLRESGVAWAARLDGPAIVAEEMAEDDQAIVIGS